MGERGPVSETATLKSGVLRDQFPIGEERHTKLGEICPSARKRFPFYFKLPYDDHIALLKWRLYVRKRCVHDTTFRNHITEMCRRDVAFFGVTLGVIFEPRPLARWLPFFLWTDQVSLLSWFTEIFGRRGGAVNKTRGIGLSWLCVLFILHAWLFKREVKIACLTEDESKLDSQDSNSLIGKLQYMFDRLPTWLKYTKSGQYKLDRHLGKHAFTNVETEAVVQGFVSRSQKLRQLRFTMVFADEFAFYDRTDQDEWVTAANGCTNCLLVVSTWNDFDDMFHYMCFEGESSLLRMNAFWNNNMERWRGAYCMVAGQVEFVDKDFDWAKEYPKGYQFGQPDLLDDGMLRSPWVDAELAQPGKDRNPLKALRDIYGKEVCERTNSFFEPAIRKALKVGMRDPTIQGRLDLNGEQPRISPTLKSHIRVWDTHAKEGDTPDQTIASIRKRGPFTVGCDLGHGAGASYSVAQFLDSGGVQVMEYGRNDISIKEFAQNLVSLCRWLSGENGDGWCLLDFESSGPLGKPFASELQRLHYGNIHYSEYSATSKPADKSMKYAGTANRDRGLNNLREFARAVLSLETLCYSGYVTSDLERCSKDDDGFPKFPTKGKHGHGDYIQAYGVAWWRARTRIALENRVEYKKERSRPAIERPAEKSRRWSDNWQLH